MTSGTRSQNLGKKFRHDHFSDSEKALLFASYTSVKKLEPPVKPHSLPTQTLNEVASTYQLQMSIQCVRKWVKLWEENGGAFVIDAARPKTYNSKRKRVGNQIDQEFKKGKTCEQVALEQFIDGDERVTICSKTAHNAAVKDLGLGAAAPKKRRIVEFTPHHAKASLTVCEAALEMEQAFEEDRYWSLGYVFEDEKGWKGSNPDTRKIFVPVEDVAVSNFQLDNNRHNVFNLYMAIYRGGVLVYHFYTEAYNANFYSEVLLPKLGVALKRVREKDGFVPTVVHHDNCLNGKKCGKALDKHVGKGLWTTYTGKPCTRKIGMQKVKCFHRQGPKIGHLKCVQNRPVYEPANPCLCDFVRESTRATATQAAANCPHLNLQELAFNRLLQIVQKNHRSGSLQYGPGAALKKIAVEAAIKEFDNEKSWFVEAYKFLPYRWQAVVDAEGFVPSNVKGVAWGSRIWRKMWDRRRANDA